MDNFQTFSIDFPLRKASQGPFIVFFFGDSTVNKKLHQDSAKRRPLKRAWSDGRGLEHGKRKNMCRTCDMYNWLVVEPTPLKNMKVSWDNEIPIYGTVKHVPKNQPAITNHLFGKGSLNLCMISW